MNGTVNIYDRIGELVRTKKFNSAPHCQQILDGWKRIYAKAWAGVRVEVVKEESVHKEKSSFKKGDADKKYKYRPLGRTARKPFME
jgi:hypothetical protein